MQTMKNTDIEILIAEDSRTQAEQLRYLLEQQGYQVTVAANGRAALAAAQARKPALLISDIVMPELDGYGLCRAIKSDDTLKDIPIILVTSLSDPHDVVDGLECGADNFIRKPYDGEYLLSRIQYLLMNLELRRNQKMQLGVEIDLNGHKHFITAERQQILDLLISTYEQAVRVNQELVQRDQELQDCNQLLTGLYRIADGLNKADSESAVAETVLERVLELPGIQAGCIWLREGESGFRLAAARNLPALDELGVCDGDCVCQRKLLSGELEHAAVNTIECERLARAMGAPHLPQHHASIPLWATGRSALGIMNLVGTGNDLFDETTLKILFGIGNQVAVALERARLHQRLERLVEERTAKLAAEIAQRKLVQQEQARLAAIIEATPDLVGTGGADGSIIYCNPAGKRMVGLAPESGQSAANFFDTHPAWAAKLVREEGIPHAIEHGTWSGETALLGPDGAEIPVLQVIIAHKTRDGSVEYLSTIARDITARVRTEASLRQLSQAVEQSPNAIVVTNLDGNIEYANAAFVKVTGYSLDEAIGQNPRLLQSGKTPKAVYEDMWAHLSHGETWQGELVNRRKDGGEYIESMLISPVRQPDGGVTHYLAIKEDVTQRRQMEEALRESEARYRRIAEGLTDYQYTVRLENGVPVETRQSPACVMVTGYTAQEFAANPHLWITMVVPEDREWVLRHIQRILSGEDVPPIEHRIVRKNGTIRWISDTAILFRDAAGNLLSYDGVIQDITERKAAEAAVCRLNEELEHKVAARTADLELARRAAEDANRAKSAFLATMSHEIRTPMNGVIGMVDVLHQTSLQGHQVEMVELIRDSAYALLGIIDDILDFSKIEAGKLELERLPMSPVEVVEKACDMLDRLAEKQKVELTLFTDPALPAQVLGDAGRLRQILVNLVNNAIKFSSGREQPGKVSVRALLAESGSQRILIEIRVADNGIGMDKDLRARLFTPFAQADASTTRRYGGTGLGLAIVQHMVTLKGGEIAVHSEPGRGSTFSVRLPFTLPPDQSPAVEEAAPVAGLSCLLVGDTDGLADDFAAYLAATGAATERAPDLAAAQTWAETCPPGLWVWIIDFGSKHGQPDELRAACKTRDGLDCRLVVIERGKRRRIRRLKDPDRVMVDGNVLNRRTFLRAVAIAAGRLWEESEAQTAGSEETAFQPPSREQALQQGRLILVAEDNETNQKVILQQLALLGYAADVAGNGREALERWQSGDHALVLTDLHMPEMDGYELAAAIRAAEQDEGRVRCAYRSMSSTTQNRSMPSKVRTAYPTQSAAEGAVVPTASGRIPIVALTANALRSEAEHCRAIGMDDYLSKPARLADLKAVLEKWLPTAANPAASSLGARASCPQPGAAAVPAAVRAKGLPPVDVGVLEGLVGNDPATIQEFLQDFRAGAARIAAGLKTACDEKQAAQAGALAHKLKSSARSVGALALGDLCAEMEQTGKAGQVETLAALLPQFEAEMAAVDRYLSLVD
ncbi:MAG: PAS domain S-box protein [Methylococcaceae bacterium]|nr:MAG: PAS domain S-box protein [Methylococcaceae bacterium]